MCESTLLVCFALYKCYVGYWWLILVAYITILLVYILQTSYKFKTNNTQYGSFVICTVAIIFLTYEAHKGKCFWALAVLTSIIFTILFYDKSKKDEKQGIIYSTTIVALIGIAIVTGCRIFEARHLVSNYVVLLSVMVLFILIVCFMGYNPGLFSENRKKELLQCSIIGIMFLILCVGISSKGGSYIKMKQKGTEVTITFDSKGKKNRVKSAKAYWRDDFTEEIIANGKKTIPKNIKIAGISKKSSYKPEKSGRLKVVVTDQYGIKTTAVRWCRVCEYKADME